MKLTFDETDEADPYSATVKAIVEALEFGMDDGISGAMNDFEYGTLSAVGRKLIRRDPTIEINPRPA